MRLRIFFLTALLVLALAPAAAIAASSSSEGYSTAAGVAQDTISEPSDDGNGNGSDLPFTGFDALAVGGAGLLLAGVGVGLRTLSRRGREPGDEQPAA